MVFLGGARTIGVACAPLRGAAAIIANDGFRGREGLGIGDGCFVGREREREMLRIGCKGQTSGEVDEVLYGYCC